MKRTRGICRFVLPALLPDPSSASDKVEISRGGEVTFCELKRTEVRTSRNLHPLNLPSLLLLKQLKKLVTLAV